MYRTTLALLLIAGNSVLFGQATEGTILGILRDASGAVVTNAVVNVKNVDTGVVRATRPNETGEYVASNLPLGAYTVSVTAPGFKQAMQPPVTLTVKARI